MNIYNYLIINWSLSIFMISNNDNRHDWIGTAIHWKFHKWTRSHLAIGINKPKSFLVNRKGKLYRNFKFRKIILQCRGNQITNNSSHVFKLSAKEWTFEQATEQNRNKQNRKKYQGYRIKNESLAWYCKSWNWFQRNSQEDWKN